jgi:hypothetical protein
VDVNVTFDASPARSSDIHADIEAIGMRDFLEESDAELCPIHEFQALVVVQVVQLRPMSVWHYHEVATVVGKQVHNNETRFTFPDNKSIPFVSAILDPTEDAFP